MTDVQEILGLKKSVEGNVHKNKKKVVAEEKEIKMIYPFKRPANMNRELYSLLVFEDTQFRNVEMLLPMDNPKGYKPKVGEKLKKARRWKVRGRKLSTRTDNLVIFDWMSDVKDFQEPNYSMAKLEIHDYSDLEYNLYLSHHTNWTKGSTDHLFDLCRRFDLKFHVIHDRWDKNTFGERTMEDLKARYYGINGTLTKLRSAPGTEPKIFKFNSDYETGRKNQLNILWNRTPEQVAEENFLKERLRKITLEKKAREAKKKQMDEERERKYKKLQRKVNESNRLEFGVPEVEISTPTKKFKMDSNANETSCKENDQTIKARNPRRKFTGIRWPNPTPGVSICSLKMNLPRTVEIRKKEIIDKVLKKFGIDNDNFPIATMDVAEDFKALRSEIVELNELVLELEDAAIQILFLRDKLKRKTDIKPEIPTSEVLKHKGLISSASVKDNQETKPSSRSLQKPLISGQLIYEEH